MMSNQATGNQAGARQPQPVAEGAAPAPLSASPSATSSGLSAAPSPRSEALVLNDMRQRLAAARAELEPAQNEVRLLKEAAAEREHKIVEMRNQIMTRSDYPEDSPEIVAATESAQLKAMQDRLSTNEQRIEELKHKLEVTDTQLKKTEHRSSRWRQKLKPLAERFRQQRAELRELRERLLQSNLPDSQDTVADAGQTIAATPAQMPDESGSTDVHANPSVDSGAESFKSSAGSSVAESVELPVAERVAESSEDAADEVTDTAAANAGDTGYDLTGHHEHDFGDLEREDLESLRGIGPALHKKLNEQGVYRLKQLADMDRSELYKLGKSVGISKKQIKKHDWVEQARSLLNIPEPGGAAALAEQETT
jgi:predicted flap endonuclease-1-like 5' DNA nuclease